MNGNEGRVWVNPDGNALAFLKKDKPKREAGKKENKRVADKEALMPESEPKAGNRTNGQAKQRKASGRAASEEVSLVQTSLVHPIVAPAIDALGLPIQLGSSSRELATLREIFDETMEVFDLSQSEGMLDSVFGRPEHRIRKKTERAELLGHYADAYIAQLRRFRTALEELGKTNDLKRQEYISRVRATRELAEEHIRLQLVAEEAQRKQRVEGAKAKAEIAKYEGEARSAARDPEPPPPAPDPLEEARRRRAMKAELHLQERETAAEVAGETVTAAKAQANEVYRNLKMTSGEKRTRIRAALDAYGVDERVLPPAILELLDEEEFCD